MDAQMLEGKVALITGASYGMGRTIAELFAEEGACVVLTARHVEQLNEVVEGIRAKGGKAVGVVADVCSTEDTKRVFKPPLKHTVIWTFSSTMPVSASKKSLMTRATSGCYMS